MNEKRRIACFFTAGYTELHAMNSFMKKINGTVEYLRLCPIAPKKSKSAIENRHLSQIDKNQSGLTRDALINYALEFMKKKRFEEERYDAILIEDDKDDRFLLLGEDGTATIDKEEWEKFKKKTLERFREVRPELPVIIFCAAPEVEAWFLADWENGFGKVYKDVLNAQQNKYFHVKFRKWVKDKILTPRYEDRMEEYGFFDGKYKKLSSEIQNALESKDFWDDDKFGSEVTPISYSKKKDGSNMLEQIEPEMVLKKCPFFFRDGYLTLQAF